MQRQEMVAIDDVRDTFLRKAVHKLEFGKFHAAVVVLTAAAVDIVDLQLEHLFDIQIVEHKDYTVQYAKLDYKGLSCLTFTFLWMYSLEESLEDESPLGS